MAGANAKTFRKTERIIVTGDSDGKEQDQTQDNLSPGSDGARVRVRVRDDEGARGEVGDGGNHGLCIVKNDVVGN